ncbi:substrate-binding domain-containing protein [Cellulomonas sp. ES6]|uniref:LacI family DNA-binding transcriptional regulator n=1 Tax=Cellulomonas sp. ES6 TaxID=3039384 RepID=UPI0024B86A9C|nr:substrate-binding domain-containing protein [Cellulomonas sp. ES6]WHP18054.1 substrate-binding domain-containing protein [Cellulomonas sp. ES6]
MQPTRTPPAAGVVVGAVVRRTRGHRGLAPFHTALFDGMEHVLAEHGGHLLVHLVATAEEETATYERWAAAGTVSAVLVSDLVTDDPRIGLCRDLGLAVVLLGEHDRTDVTRIDVDNDAAMGAAVDFLVRLGHTRIGRVSGPPELFHTAIRTRAFARHVAAAGAHGTTVEGDYSADSGAAALRALLTADPGVTAVMFDNDVMAVAALDAAAALGRRVPQDLSLLAWDDSPECRLAHPPLSVVARDIRGLGLRSAEVLLAPEPVRVVQARGVLVVPRGSTAPPAPPVQPGQSGQSARVTSSTSA